MARSRRGILSGITWWEALLTVRSILRWKEIPHERVRSVVIIELTRLGDVLAMVPALILLRQTFPLATVHLVVDHSYASLLEAMNLGLGIHGVSSSATGAGFFEAVRVTRRLDPDLAISMSPTKRNAVLCFFSGAKANVGYLAFINPYEQNNHPVQVRASGFRLQAELTFGREHISRRSLNICRALGCKEHSVVEVGRILDAFRDVLDRTAAHPGSVPSNHYVVIHPFSGWSFRSWPPERFQALAEYLGRSLGFDVIFICSVDENSLLDGFRKRFEGNRAMHFFPSPALLDTAAIIRRASLFVGNDSGPLHLATLLGVPCVGLFGPSPPELTAPLSDRNVYLYHRVDCCPCGQTVCIRPDIPCIGLISAGEVNAAVTQLLGQPSLEQAVKNG